MWTKPRTFRDGEYESAPIWNLIRDDLAETEPAKIKDAGRALVGVGAHALEDYQTHVVASAYDLINTAAFVDIPGVVFPVFAGQRWIAEYWLQLTFTGTINGFCAAFTHPGIQGSLTWKDQNANLRERMTRVAIPASGVQALQATFQGNTLPYGSGVYPTTSFPLIMALEFYVPTPGLVQLRGRQQVAGAAATHVEPSLITLRRLL